MTEPRFDRLVALLPQLRRRGGSVVAELLEVVYADGVLLLDGGFDWPKYAAELSERGWTKAELRTADLDECRRVLTIVVRQDRFVENSLTGDVRSGLMAAIVRRIAELVKEKTDAP